MDVVKAKKSFKEVIAKLSFENQRDLKRSDLSLLEDCFRNIGLEFNSGIATEWYSELEKNGYMYLSITLSQDKVDNCGVGYANFIFDKTGKFVKLDISE